MSVVDNAIVAKFSKSGVWDKVPNGSTQILGEHVYFLMTQRGIGGRKPPCRNQLDSSSRFDTIPVSDRRMDGQTDTRRQHIPR